MAKIVLTVAHSRLFLRRCSRGPQRFDWTLCPTAGCPRLWLACCARARLNAGAHHHFFFSSRRRRGRSQWRQMFPQISNGVRWYCSTTHDRCPNALLLQRLLGGFRTRRLERTVRHLNICKQFLAVLRYVHLTKNYLTHQFRNSWLFANSNKNFRNRAVLAALTSAVVILTFHFAQSDWLKALKGYRLTSVSVFSAWEVF